MKPKMVLKIGVDVAMTAALLLLMAYALVGEAAHEWIGVSMFVLFVLHHILNRKWSGNLLKGKYTPFRIWQTLLVLLVLASMIGSMISGIILSEDAFDFLAIRGGQSWARTVHLLCSYWGFVFMSLHLGLHWCMMMGMAKKQFRAPSRLRTWALRGIAVAIAVYGAFVFVNREIGSYMFLKNEFVFFNFEEPLAFFFLDYLAVMGLFVFLGHYFSGFLKWLSRKRKRT